MKNKTAKNIRISLCAFVFALTVAGAVSLLAPSPAHADYYGYGGYAPNYGYSYYYSPSYYTYTYRPPNYNYYYQPQYYEPYPYHQDYYWSYNNYWHW